MSDWDFLHDMHNSGYNSEQIADAAACGYNPWEWAPTDEKEFLGDRQEFEFEGRIIERKRLSKGEGTYARVDWLTLNADKDESKT
jgi:hypothetical protein